MCEVFSTCFNTAVRWWHHCWTAHAERPGQTTTSSVKSCSYRLQCRLSSSDVLYSLHWLPVRRRIEFKTATLCFKAVKCSNPPYLKNMLKPYEPLRSLRSSHYDLLTVPRTDTSFCFRCFSVVGPRIWNGLPHELRQCKTLLCVKSHLKKIGRASCRERV